MTKKIFLFIIVALMIDSAPLLAAIYYASPTGSGTTCSEGLPCSYKYTIETKASAGDTVTITAGTYSIDTGGGATVNKAMVIVGQGNPTIQRGTLAGGLSSAMLTIQPATDDSIDISGITFDNVLNEVSTDKYSIRVIGPSDGAFGLTKVRIHGNTFNKGAKTIHLGGWTEILIDNNIFHNSNIAIFVGGDPLHSHKRDIITNTAHSNYIENNTFTTDNDFDITSLNEQVYHQSASRSVVRWNTFDLSGTTTPGKIISFYDSHGNWGTCASPFSVSRGQPILEVYNNVFKAYSVAAEGNINSFKIMDFRGGSFLVHHNDVYTAVGSTKFATLWEEEAWTTGGPFCPTACPCFTEWPAEDQVTNSFFWSNNTYWAGATSPTAVTASDISGNGSHLTEDTYFIQENRDFFMHAPQSSGGKSTIPYNATYGYVTGPTYDIGMTFSSEGANAYYPYATYTCPHPLASLSGVCDSDVAGVTGYNVATQYTLSGGMISGGVYR